ISRPGEVKSFLTTKIEAVKKDVALMFKAVVKNLLDYQFELRYRPAGVYSNYKRSGFIHPVWAPNAQVLTRIQPPDHYHHYGIWNPWTHTLFENDTVDFWNIKGRQGTVRFAKFGKLEIRESSGSFETLHEHIVFNKDGSEKVALNEWQSITV